MKKQCMGTIMAMGLITSFALPSTGVAAGKVNVSGGVTYGSYSGSQVRDNLLKETLNLSYTSEDYTGGGTIHFENVTLENNRGYDDIDQYQYGISGYKSVLVDGVGYIGGRVDLQYLDSDDQLTDNTAVPYFALTFKSLDGKYYFDAGYSYSNYDNPDIDQYTGTVGISLLDGMVWSQTRLYYIDTSEKTQGENSTFAVEERLSYYAIPKILTVSIYGLVGKRLYAYDPDIFSVYNLADVQQGSLGGTVSYQLNTAWSVLGDVTYESYENDDLDDDYSITYFTVALNYGF